MTTHPKGRLSRQELGWLLTQEARGAAERLRKGVQVLLTNALPPGEPAGEGGVDQTLDALDDAVKMLASIHHKPVGGRGRRGRIDLASLLWEVAPDARVSLEPGSGTEVFGEEAELRRMLHVLVGPGSRAGSVLNLKRDGDEVRLSITLGPDSSVTSDAERAWLHRMALRYGGRYELEGGMEVLALPAGDGPEREERDALRRELVEARKQGEAYARELAALGSSSDDTGGSSILSGAAVAAEHRIAEVARLAGAVAAELRATLSPVGWDLLALRELATAGLTATAGPIDDRLESIQQRVLHVQDFVSELGMVGELDPTEPRQDVDLGELVRSIVRALRPRALRLGVEVVEKMTTRATASNSRVIVRASPRVVNVIIRELLLQAMTATPRGKSVSISVMGDSGQGEGSVVVEDGGPSVPEHARQALLSLDVEPGTYGRTSGLALHIAQTLAVAVVARFTFEEAQNGGMRATVTFSG